MTLDEFIKTLGITITATGAENDLPWPGAAHKWDVILHRPDGRTFETPFYAGELCVDILEIGPTARDVLLCVAADCATVADGISFEEWAAELGYDPDSRKAEGDHKKILAEAERLSKFLDEGEIDTLLWKVDADETESLLWEAP